MLALLIIGFLLSIALTAMSTALRSMSLPYLKYWARKGELISKQIYPLKSRGSATYITIELFRAVVLSATLVAMADLFGWFLGLVIGAVVFFVVFIVLTELYLRPVGIWLLAKTSPYLLRLSFWLKPVTTPLGRAFDRFLAEEPVTITRSELEDTLVGVQPVDTDLSADEIRILRHALTFGKKTVHDIMTPRTVISSVHADDVISPILLDELHKTGHSRFPVFDQENEIVAGMLYIKDLVESKKNATVADFMHSPVHYVNEERELDHVLQAFIRTKQHMFIVVNQFAEITGLITIEDIVEQVLGKPIIDEFDQYDSMRDVADAKAKKVKKQLKSID
ncbi:CBS domain-containing protein [Candidatus Saccharibacteria bacterium]|nr:CBS domain-containing protein [Candidatus Saccharibacteria bacterium]